MMRKTFLFFLFVFLLLSPCAQALGIGPTEIEIGFKPNLNYTGVVYVVNSEGYNFPVEMSVDGDLKDYITLSEKEFVLMPKGTPGSIRYVNFTLNLPEKFEKPGAYKSRILATQKVSGEKGTIVSRVRVGAILTVYVPYPGKYVEFEVKIENAEVNKTVKFTASAVNRGNQTIENAYCVFRIYDLQGSVIGSATTDGKVMEPGRHVEFMGEWLASNVKPGKYRLVAEISYDDIKTKQEKEFMIGSPTIEITEINAEPIPEKTIGKIRTKVKSNWNEKIENIFLTIELKKNGFSTSLKSPSTDIEPWQEKYIDIYWDTSDSQGAGEYDGLATLSYLNKTAQKSFKVRVVKAGITLFTPEAVLLLLVVVIIIILAVVYYRRRKS